ncbi:hypothetical protein LguiA_013892 [Lonicera macranthoides]
MPPTKALNVNCPFKEESKWAPNLMASKAYISTTRNENINNLLLPPQLNEKSILATSTKKSFKNDLSIDTFQSAYEWHSSMVSSVTNQSFGSDSRIFNAYDVVFKGFAVSSKKTSLETEKIKKTPDVSTLFEDTLTNKATRYTITTVSRPQRKLWALACG